MLVHVQEIAASCMNVHHIHTLYHLKIIVQIQQHPHHHHHDVLIIYRYAIRIIYSLKMWHIFTGVYM